MGNTICLALARGHITFVEVRTAFPRGQSFPQCVAQLLLNDGTLSLPMPPAIFLGRGTHLDAAMQVEILADIARHINACTSSYLCTNVHRAPRRFTW